jgi:hypothetical protein
LDTLETTQDNIMYHINRFPSNIVMLFQNHTNIKTCNAFQNHTNIKTCNAFQNYTNVKTCNAFQHHKTHCNHYTK